MIFLLLFVLLLVLNPMFQVKKFIYLKNLIKLLFFFSKLLKPVLLSNYYYSLLILNVRKNKSTYSIKYFSFLVRSNNPIVKNFKFTTSTEDFEFKKFLINTVVILSRIPVINEVYFIVLLFCIK